MPAFVGTVGALAAVAFLAVRLNLIFLSPAPFRYLLLIDSEEVRADERAE